MTGGDTDDSGGLGPSDLPSTLNMSGSFRSMKEAGENLLVGDGKDDGDEEEGTREAALDPEMTEFKN